MKEEVRHTGLEQFVRRRNAGCVALVAPGDSETLVAALTAGTGCVPAGKAGRGEVLRFPYEEGTALVRRYLRGGLIRYVLPDAYVLINRPLRELRVHAYLYAKGLSVPEPLGVCWRRRALLVRGTLATREVDACNLLEHLRAPDAMPEDAVRQCGALIRRMHDLGVVHADLQVRNILVGAGRTYLIDFDNARITGEVSPTDRARNLYRLRRSMEKNGVALEHFETLCDGYGAETLPGWLGHAYRAKGRLSDLAAGRRAPRETSREP